MIKNTRTNKPEFSFPRYCGELSSLALTSDTNVLDVNFHSDESYTDKGFSAEYSAYDPSNRESKVLSNNYLTFRKMGELLWHNSDTPNLPLQSKTWGVTVRLRPRLCDKELSDSQIELFSDGAFETAVVQLKG